MKIKSKCRLIIFIMFLSAIGAMIYVQYLSSFPQISLDSPDIHLKLFPDKMAINKDCIITSRPATSIISNDRAKLIRQVLYPNVRILVQEESSQSYDPYDEYPDPYGPDGKFPSSHDKNDLLPIDPDWSGSGSVVYVDKIGAVVLTAKHVTMDSGIIYVQVFYRDNEYNPSTVENYEAFVLREEAGDIDVDYSLDIALLRVPGLISVPPANLADHGVKLAEKVYGAHCSLGSAPYLTQGFVSQLPEDEEADNLFACSHLANPGASGSGVYVKRDGEYQLVGVLVRGWSRSEFMIMCIDWPRIEYLLQWALVLDAGPPTSQPSE